MNTIEREELKKKIDQKEDFLLLEVLSEASYQKGHLPGAVRYKGRDQIERLAPDMNATIIAYCSNFN